MKNLFTCLLFFIITGAAISQTTPDYKERSLVFLNDSLNNVNPSITASEGIIDPKEYIVGPGDKIFLSIAGSEEIALNLVVNQEGYLYIPKVGGIDLRKTTLDKAKEKISAAVNKYYKNVDIFISLSDFRRIKVSLIGDVKKPSTYILPGNARLLDIISISSGLNPTSNYRNIKILNREGKSTTYDLLEFLRFGLASGNPMLNEGDAVIVDKVDRVVYISGLVKYPGSYEFKENEKVIDFINMSGGLLNKARKDTIEIISFDNNGLNQISKYYSLEELKTNNIVLSKQDQIVVRQIPEYYIDRYVQVNGFVKYPGYYKIIKGKTTLSDIIKEAGGFRKDASLTEATINRNQGTVENDPEFDRLKLIPRADMSDDEYDYLKSKSRQRVGKVIVDFERLFSKEDSTENIILKNGDVITIPEAKNYIIILGQVVNPGNLIYKPNLKVDDYINLAGGFGWRAKENDVRVIKANTGEWIDADNVDELKPGDTIWVLEKPQPPKFWDVVMNTLTILGQVATVVAAVVAVIISSR